VYIAVAFVCLVTSECDFVVSRHVESLTECELRNVRAHEYLEAAAEVKAYKTTCVLVLSSGSRT
jgi:hypothetical protein